MSRSLLLPLLFAGSVFADPDPASGIHVPKDFKIERIYEVPGGQGSWVAITKDDKGRFICSDQYGGLYRVEAGAAPKVEKLEVKISGAHGLLWFQGVLYVSINEAPMKSGVWMVKPQGDQFSEPVLVKEFKGRGEHGPHQMVPSPDGQWIYVTCGNFTDLPGMDGYQPAKVWQEDQLLTRCTDPRGHDPNQMAPGGWIARFKPDGGSWELYASGFRNTYDIAFNDRGDLFGYDSDMEWDFGTPWYRPTRLCEILPGGEYGWRNGSGKWPVEYEDNYGSLVDFGPGSPTGVVAGRGAKFPEAYQRALYTLDWTFATVRAIHLEPQGTSYKATSEEFITGTGLPFTDAVIGDDGAMYLLTGGRKTGSAMWKVTYTGSASTAPVKIGREADPLAAFKSAIDKPTPAAINSLWEKLGSSERTERFLARTALEKLPPASWAPRLDAEKDAWRVIGASIGLARVSTKEDRARALSALDRLDWSKLSSLQRINWLRACDLEFIRGGEPQVEERQKVLAKIDKSFPTGDEMVDRELCRLLCYLQAPGIVGRTLTAMDLAGPGKPPAWTEIAARNSGYGKPILEMLKNLPPAQVLHYVYCLRAVKGPWGAGERERFFSWVDRLASGSGGASYGGFVAELRKQALANATPEERVRFEKPAHAAANPMANLPPVKGPGKDWTVDEVAALAAGGLSGRDKENGRNMFKASLCAACHAFNGEGGDVGPDLTTLGGRFKPRDIADAIINPSAVVSDQFAYSTITRKDGSSLFGRMLKEENGKVIVGTNPFDTTQTVEVPKDEITSMERSSISPMPGALINRLNPDELKDLLAFLTGAK
ncbi:c-type cytochrome [Luteolibacter ambystomatis]